MPELAMFPLGSALVPRMPLLLRVFEERYLRMLAEVLPGDAPSFGVVLIERGQEVGGGEHPFSTGTVAQITEIAGGDGFVAVNAIGTERFEIVRWIDDSPFPLAEIRYLEPLVWNDELTDARATAESSVRRALAVVGEYSDQRYAPEVELADDPLEACWQLLGIAPIGDLDTVALLGSSTLGELLNGLTVLAEDVIETFGADWGDASAES